MSPANFRIAMKRIRKFTVAVMLVVRASDSWPQRMTKTKEPVEAEVQPEREDAHHHRQPALVDRVERRLQDLEPRVTHKPVAICAQRHRRLHAVQRIEGPAFVKHADDRLRQQRPARSWTAARGTPPAAGPSPASAGNPGRSRPPPRATVPAASPWPPPRRRRRWASCIRRNA